MSTLIIKVFVIKTFLLKKMIYSKKNIKKDLFKKSVKMCITKILKHFLKNKWDLNKRKITIWKMNNKHVEIDKLKP